MSEFTVVWKGSKSGPYSRKQLEQLVAEGSVRRTHSILREGVPIPWEEICSKPASPSILLPAGSESQPTEPKPQLPPPLSEYREVGPAGVNPTSSSFLPLPGLPAERVSVPEPPLPLSPPPVPTASREEIFLVRDGQQIGPFSVETVREMLVSGQTSSATLAWKLGRLDWTALENILVRIPVALGQTSAPLPPPPAPIPAEAPAHRPSLELKLGGVTGILKVCLSMEMLAVIACMTILFGLVDATSRGLEPSPLLPRLLPGVYSAQIALTALAGTTFLIWFYRVYRNCRTLGAENLGRSAGWAVGSFFVPIANLFVPYLAMREAWMVSGNPRNWRSEPVGGIVHVWWTFSITASVIGGFTGATYGQTQLAIFGFLFLAGMVLRVALILVTLNLVTQINHRQFDIVDAAGAQA